MNELLSKGLNGLSVEELLQLDGGDNWVTGAKAFGGALLMSSGFVTCFGNPLLGAAMIGEGMVIWDGMD